MEFEIKLLHLRRKIYPHLAIALIFGRALIARRLLHDLIVIRDVFWFLLFKSGRALSCLLTARFGLILTFLNFLVLHLVVRK